jgi:hypothetical protein
VLTLTDESGESHEWPCDVLCVIELAREPTVDASDTAVGDVAGESSDEDGGSVAEEAGSVHLAFVQVYRYVFSKDDASGPQRHVYNPTNRYVCLSDVFELVTVAELLRPALLIPNPSQQSPRDRSQRGLSSVVTSGIKGERNAVRPHYFWIDQWI